MGVGFLSTIIRGATGNVWKSQKFFGLLKVFLPVLVSVFVVILILEKVLKLLLWILEILFDMVHHITSKDHRRVYILTIISMLLLGMYLEDSYNSLYELKTFVVDAYNAVKDQVIAWYEITN